MERVAWWGRQQWPAIITIIAKNYEVDDDDDDDDIDDDDDSTWAKAWWEGGHGLEIQGNNPGNDNSLIILWK